MEITWKGGKTNWSVFQKCWGRGENKRKLREKFSFFYNMR